MYSGLIVIHYVVDFKIYIYRYGDDLPENPDFIYTVAALHVRDISAVIDIDRNIFYVMWLIFVPFGTSLSGMLKFGNIYFYKAENSCFMDEN